MTKTTLIFLLVLSSNPLSLRMANQSQEDIMGHVNQLRSIDSGERSRAAKLILQSKPQITNRQSLVREIENIAREFVDNETRAGSAKTAISLLGDLEAVDSIPFLVEHLTFEVFYKQAKRPQTIDDRFPCAGALIKIGRPSIDPLLAKVESNDNEKVLRIAAFVAKRVLGNSATAYIQERGARQSNQIIQSRLLRLQQYINQ